MPKRRVLLVDDEVPVLLTMKAVLEISGFDVDTATSAREGRARIKKNEYQMIITDMRMESDAAGPEVIEADRSAPYHPSVALLTAFPMSDEDWRDMGADKMLVKPMQTAQLIKQLEKLLENHAAKLSRLSLAAAGAGSSPKKSAKLHDSAMPHDVAKPHPTNQSSAIDQPIASTEAGTPRSSAKPASSRRTAKPSPILAS